MMGKGGRGHVVILGGGVAGLGAAYYLARAGFPVTLVEKSATTGGLCASFQSHGFTLDHGPHKLYSVVPGILDEIRRILGDELIEHRKKNRIRLLGCYLDYPLRLTNLLPLLGPVRSLRLGLTYAEAVARRLMGRHGPRSYEEYIIQRFGRGVYELVFEPLAWKVWGDPRALSPELAEARIPAGGATDLLLRLLKIKDNTAEVDAPYFYYPRGGFGRFPARLADEIQRLGGEILTGATPQRLVRADGRITAVEVEHEGSPSRIPCETVVSSIPIHALARLLFPDDVGLDAEARQLRFRNLVLVYLVLTEDRVMEDHWLFFPERQFPFNRVFEQKAMSPTMGPPGRTVLCCDFTCDDGDAVWNASDEDLVSRCLGSLVEADLTRPGAFETGFVRRFRSFYPTYSVDYRERLGRVYARLKKADNLVLTGRLGMFNYNNSDHCLDMGRFIAGEMAQGRPSGEIWSALEERVRSYRIVD